MPIIVRCNDCGAMLKFHDDALGKKGKCRKCRGVVQVVAASRTRESDGNDDAGFLGSLTDAGAASQSEIIPVIRERPAQAPVTTSAISVEDAADDETRLGARPRVRIVAFVLLLAPILFASGLNLPQRLLACFTPLVLAGTFRTSTIRGDRFKTSFHMAFLPVVTHRCNLRGVACINVRFGWDGPGVGTILMFGAFQATLGWLFEFLIPAIGGPYEIRLVTAKGRELVVWQGFVDSKFRSTLELLVRLTNAEVKSM